MRLGFCIPLLDLVETLEERDWDEDDNRLLSVADFDLYHSGHTYQYMKFKMSCLVYSEIHIHVEIFSRAQLLSFLFHANNIPFST